MTGKATIIICIICLFVGAALGAWGMHTWSESDRLAAWKAQHELEREKSKPPTILTETKTKTEVAYVPKEVVIYRDQASGQEIKTTEKTDVQLNVKPPSVWMRYNGQNFEIQGLPGEKTKFEHGKLIGEISTASTVDVTDLVNKEVALQREADRHRLNVDLITNIRDTAGIGLRISKFGVDYIRDPTGKRVLGRWTIIQ